MKLFGGAAKVRRFVGRAPSLVQLMAPRAATAGAIGNEVSPQGTSGGRETQWALQGPLGSRSFRDFAGRVADAEAEVTGSRCKWAVSWGLWLARVLLVGQFLWLAGFSWVEFHRGALTFDYSVFNQGAWLIAHGRFEPYDTVRGLPLWRNNGELILWPLSVLTYLPPEGLWLLWAQDLAVCVTGWVTVSWAAEFLAHRPRAWWRSTGVLLACVLWVANPKVYATAAFDFHTEVLGACFAVLAGRELWRGRARRAWAWLALVLATGFVASTYAAALGAVVLTLRHGPSRAGVSRRVGVGVVAVALGWMGVLILLHGNVASDLAAKYGYLAAGTRRSDVSQIAVSALTHPSRVLAQLRLNSRNLWANLAPNGLIGVLSPWGLFMVVLVTVPDTLVSGTNFASVGFQNFPAFAFVLFGTVVTFDRLLAALSAKWLGVVLAGCAALWAGLSGITVLPTYPSYWWAVSAKAGRTLALVRALIPPGAEVVASQGISGRFSSRGDALVIVGLPYEITTTGKVVYFVLSPTVGLQTTAPGNTLALKGWLESRGARVILERSDIWLLGLRTGGVARSLLLPGRSAVCRETGGSATSPGGCYSPY